MHREPGPQRRTETVAVGEATRAAEAFAPRLPRGTRLAGRYRLDGILGSGGYGVVYAARDERDGRPVAVKVLRTDRVSPSALARFRRESALARGIEHPHLVAVLDSGRDGDSVYLVMERVEGETLADRLERGPLAPAEAVRLACDLLSALRVLHRAGIVHRDLKPANVLLEHRGPSPGPSSARARLADFGLALRWGSDEPRATATAEVLGTVEYLAPEQALEGRSDARSDLYSLGVVLYEMLTGEPPFRGRSSLGTLVARLRSGPADVRDLRPEVPEWLAAVVSRLLARRPAERHASAAGVLRDLRAGPRGRRRLAGVGRAGAGLAGAAAVVLLLGALPRPAPEVEQDPAAAPQPAVPGGALAEVARSEDGLTGIGEDGGVLWHLPGVDGRLVRARLEPGEGTVLVGTIGPRDRLRELPSARVLSVLDPATGETLRTVELSTAEGSFPGFAPRYGTRPAAIDLDRDGLDEVLTVFYHDPYWPSFVTLYEPLLGRSRVMFVASGHQSFSGAADVDGDGRDELLFQGINNRMELGGSLAAVRPVPPVNRPAPPSEWGRALTPDITQSPGPRDALAWYALLPRRFATSAPPSKSGTIDPAARTVTVHGVEGPPAVISFDGFRVDLASEIGPAERRRQRRALYRGLRESRRLSASGLHGAALEQVEAAEGGAARIGDPLVLEHARRQRAKLLVEEGSYARAERLFRELAAGSEDRQEVAFAAARWLHLAGQPERALAWYRSGLRSSTEGVGFRGWYEYLEGIVFCLEELGRPEEARRELEGFLESGRLAPRSGDLRHARMLRTYLRWRQGELTAADVAVAGEQGPRGADLFVYLDLEFALALGEDPETLLPRVERALESATETVPMLLSLCAELLDRLNRPRAATAVARSALDELERRRDDEVYPRAFRGLVEERHHRIAGPDPADRAAGVLRAGTARPRTGERLAAALPAGGRGSGGW